MNALEGIALEIINPTKCAICPNRNPLGRVIAKTALGADYTADGCNPALVTSDGDLRNELFDRGDIDKPYGLRAAPEYTASALSGAPEYSHPRRVAVNFRFGFSSLVCPRDIRMFRIIQNSDG